MIQAGLEDPRMKKPPMHLSEEAFVIIKSEELIVQVLPPNDKVTLTLVLQAKFHQEREFRRVMV